MQPAIDSFDHVPMGLSRAEPASAAERLTLALGGQWNDSRGRACCPAHSDRKPSLSIGSGDGGKILLKCHARCSFEDVIAALRRKGLLPRSPKREIVAYDYCEENGELRYQVIRYEPKDFRQCRPDGHGGRIWNMKDVEPVPYNLPYVLDNPNYPVFIAEGEKDVGALHELGLVATCNHGGAGKWHPKLSRWFKDRNVVILPDNDQPGREHATDVARKLHGIAASIRILKLPRLPLKGDVSDWIEAGGMRADLWRLAKATPKWDAGADAGLGEWDAGLDKAEIRPRAWLLGNVFCRGFLSSVIASGGVGKTALRILQALALATGQELTREHVFQRCRVLYVSLEDGPDELRRRVRAAMLHYGLTAKDVEGWLFLATPAGEGWKLAITKNGELQLAGLVARLAWTIKSKRIDLVILDPFIKTHSVEENDNTAIDFVASILAKLAVQYNCAIDAPHHTAKGAPEAGNADKERGASAFKDAARLVYTLTPMSAGEAKAFKIADDERKSIVRLDSGKVNIAPSASAKWFQLVGVELNNRTTLYRHGDTVQTVEPWTPPALFDGMDDETVETILAEIDEGLPDGRRYTDHIPAGEREAWRVVVKHRPEKTEQQARDIVRIWVSNGMLELVEYHDAKARKDRKGLRLKESVDAPR